MILGVTITLYVILLLAVIWKPPVAMAPVICMFGLEQCLMANSAFFRGHGSLVNLAIGILVLVGLISNTIKGGRIAFYWPAVGWVVIGIHAYYALSFFWAYSPEWTVSNLYFAGPYTLTVSFAMALLFRNLKDVRLGLIVTVALASLLSILLISTTRIHEWGRTIDFGGDIAGTRYDMSNNRGNPLAIADLGAALSGIALLIQFPKSNKVWSLLKWGAAFLGFALIFRSGSRGQFVGIILAVGALYKFSRPKTNFQAIITMGLSAILFGGLIWLALAQFGDFGRFDVSQFGQAYRESRLSKCAILLDGWVRSSPLTWMFGLGGAASWGIQGIYPHVVPIEILAELGFFGLFVYLCILAMAIQSFYRLGKLTSDSSVDRATVAVLASLFLFHWIMSMKQGTFLVFYHSYFIAILAARVEWSCRRERRQSAARARAKHYWRAPELQY